MINDANTEIAHLQFLAESRHARLDRLDRVVRTIDRLLWELEDLNLQEVDRVPVGLRERAQAVLEGLPQMEGYEDLKIRYRVVPMMDALFRAQEVLFRLKHPTMPFPDEEEAV